MERLDAANGGPGVSMDRGKLEKLALALSTVLDRLGYTLEDEPTQERFSEMLAAYLRAQGPPPSRNAPQAFRDAMAQGRPITVGGKVLVSVDSVLNFMRRRWRGLTNKRLVVLLRGLGARPKAVYTRRGFTTLLSRRYWVLPENLIPTPLKGSGKNAAALPPDLEAILGSASILDLLKALEGLSEDLNHASRP